MPKPQICSSAAHLCESCRTYEEKRRVRRNVSDAKGEKGDKKKIHIVSYQIEDEYGFPGQRLSLYVSPKENERHAYIFATFCVVTTGRFC